MRKPRRPYTRPDLRFQHYTGAMLKEHIINACLETYEANHQAGVALTQTWAATKQRLYATVEFLMSKGANLDTLEAIREETKKKLVERVHKLLNSH